MFSTGEGSHAPIHVPGRHLMLELYGCPAEYLTDAVRIKAVLDRAAGSAGVRVLAVALHTFPGGGLTCVMVLAESHLSIHTWPEHAYAAVDMFTCGPGSLEAAITILRMELGAHHAEQRVLARGALIRPLDPVEGDSIANGDDRD
jgi:S-adenosylmethionine decarboxylase